MMPTRLARLGMALVLGALAALPTACGYALAGRGNHLPLTMKRIGVPDFQNLSGIPDVDRVLTDAVRAEFSGRGKYTILPQATDVDGLLTGTIVSFSVQPQDVNQQTRLATSYKVYVTVRVEFHDLNDSNKTLWANPAWQFTEPYTSTNNQLAADPTTVLRQDSDAMSRLAKDFAQSVVTAIMEAF
jgi:hypothetical protein